jgi:S1-C subfamily serine protease
MPATYGNERVPFPRVPKKDESAIMLNSIGAEVVDVEEDLAKQLGLRDVTSGAAVIRVVRDTPAAESGLFPGMVITKADKKPIKSATDLRDALKDGALKKGVLLQGQSTATGTVYAIVKTAETASN